MKVNQIKDSIDDMETVYIALLNYYDNDNIYKIDDNDIQTLARIEKITRKATRK